MPSDYDRIERAIIWLKNHYRENPGPDSLAAILDLNPAQTQRLFRRWAGIGPDTFIRFFSIAFNKNLLRRQSVLDAAFASGLSSPARRHDRIAHIETVSTGTSKSSGAGLTIKAGCFESPFGPTFFATSQRGTLRLAFTEDEESELEHIAREWPKAEILTRDADIKGEGRKLFLTLKRGGRIETPLCVRGTTFQVKVWKTLLNIEAGHVTTYRAIAQAVGAPNASRAVGSAVGANPIALLIPCHRVIKSNGDIGIYHWGATRKQAILAWECAVKSGMLEAMA